MNAAHTRRVSAGLISALAGLVLLFPVATPAEAATVYVNAGGDLQAALNAAQPGDEIVLQAGARFVAEFRLPPKPAGPVITIRSSATLPNRRITPADASLLPTLAAGVIAPALDGTNAANWRFDGVQFESTSNGHGEVVVLQDSTNITFDRVLIVGGAYGQKRGIRGNGMAITLTRSHIANIWRTDQETQAFAAWDGAGPYTLTDNYLEAGSITVLFGGANSKSADRVPSDILVEGNHMSKRLEWKGQSRVVKNLFELKSARRVVIRNNLFERNWSQAQNGYAILFTVRNDEGGAPWSVIEDVLFENNIVRDTENGINILGYDGYQPSGRATRLTIRNNLVLASNRFMLIGGEVGSLVLDHNTVAQNGNMFFLMYKGDVWVSGTAARRAARFAVESLTVTNTIGYHGEYGVFADEGLGIGTLALQNLTGSYTWTHNVLAGEQGWGRSYPGTTWQPGMAEHSQQFNSDHTLASSSWYRGLGLDAQDLGRLTAAGSTIPPPPPPPAPSPEICGDGIDNNGDGQIDEGCTVAPTLPPAVMADTTPPTVTLTVVVDNRAQSKLRIDATDESGIAAVRVLLNGQLLQTGTSVPLDVTVGKKALPSGSHLLNITVTDRVGNDATVNHIIVK